MSAVPCWRQLWPGGILPAAKSALRTLTRTVRDGGSIGLLVDHRDSIGPSVPFFGHPAPSVVLPARLAVRSGADGIAARVDRLPNVNFAITRRRISVADSGDVAADELNTTAAIQATLETWIRSDRGSWLWFYKQWCAMDGLQMPKHATVAASVVPVLAEAHNSHSSSSGHACYRKTADTPDLAPGACFIREQSKRNWLGLRPSTSTQWACGKQLLQSPQ